MTKIHMALAAFSMIALTGCETTGGVATSHISHSVTAEERALVHATLSSKLKARGLQIEKLQATEHLDSGMITICGYVTGITPAGTRSKPAVFGGTITANQKSAFTLLGGGGSGQDASRSHAVKTICQANEIYI
ncbi:hypothetical protein [Hoeflea olei]|uniref:Uncharacterized protein n=1 Tax=Hoeflea olei TaxID=1480615 RepID=A0A1C1YQ32_9HYPH|nr:hypothetical protein [Hoeflea olei]OCW55516.1 hypothetical protein AWJ14_05845 [Hoeflea olei]